jgi:YqjK-like protein
MMRGRLLLLAERRAGLAARASAERESLAAFMARTDKPVRIAASALAAGRRLLDEARRQPLLVAAGVALLIALRPRRALGWALKGWTLWRTVRSAQRWWQLVSGTIGAPANR